MNIRISPAVKEALHRIEHVPDDLGARLAAIAPAGDGGFELALSDDDATALAELVQWHIKTDPVTGRPTPESAPYDELIRLIDQAQF